MTREEMLALRQRFEATLITKAWADPAFRARLLANPKAVIGEELRAQGSETPLADDLQLVVAQETPTEMCIVLPLDPDAAEPDLLDEIAGGSGARRPCKQCSVLDSWPTTGSCSAYIPGPATPSTPAIGGA